MNQFNFKSQTCTSLEQGERLLSLGLKKETADMRYVRYEGDIEPCIRAMPWCEFVMPCENNFPAWSLHRLIQMMPNKIRIYDDSVSLIVSNTKVQYYSHDVEYSDYLSCAGKWEDGNVYHNIISCIEWLIKEGYFNKDYLCEK